MQDVITAISTVGFPIVSFFIAAYGLKYAYDKSLEQSDKDMEKISTLTEAVNNNTIVLTQLVEEMRKEEKFDEQ